MFRLIDLKKQPHLVPETSASRKRTSWRRRAQVGKAWLNAAPPIPPGAVSGVGRQRGTPAHRACHLHLCCLLPA